MKDILPEICDKYEEKVTLLDIPLQSFGMRPEFFGEAVTVRCFHDNSIVIEALQQDGKGKVLVVDGNGSNKKALLDGQLAITAIENGWEGVIVYGALRDVAALSQMDIGIKALSTSPFKTDNKGSGEMNVCLTMNRQMVHPGDYIYADWNGTLVTETELPI